MAEQPYKTNIFELLSQIDKKNPNWFDMLPEDQQKAVAPLILMRWLSGATNSFQIVALNEYVNRYVFALSKHKGLLAKLLTTCTDGKSHRYKWMKSNATNHHAMPLAVDVISRYYKISKREAEQSIRLVKLDHLMRFAEELGLQNDEISKLKSEFNKNSS